MSRWSGGVDALEQAEKPHICASEGACRHPGAQRAWLPADALQAALGERTPAQIERDAGFGHDTLCRWFRDGRVPLEHADRVAVAMRLHPAEVWGDAWWAAA